MSDNYLVLIVEDNPINTIMLQSVLEGMNVECDSAENGLEALHKAKMHQYDLILMDLQMPIMNGYEATYEIRRLGPENKEVPIIALTASKDREIIDKCEECGITECMLKPIEPEDLQSILKKYKRTLYLATDRIVGELHIEQQAAEELMSEFIKQAEVILAYIQESCNQNDFEKAGIWTHKLKGMCATLRMKEWYKKLCDLELLCKNGAIEYKKEMHDLWKMLEELK